MFARAAGGYPSCAGARRRRARPGLQFDMLERRRVQAIPYGATPQDTSELMLGTVAVDVVLLESDGGIDPSTEDWTPAQIAEVTDEINEGLAWWEEALRRRGSVHAVDFLPDFTHAATPVATRYEPIARPYGDHPLWVGDFLAAVGIDAAGDEFAGVRRHDHARRVAAGTDWAFTAFVVNSAADADGMFADGQFAYGYYGGPFLVITYDAGDWRIARLGEVFAHEVGHIFYALDEYSGGSPYGATSGYYNTQNVNAIGGNPDPSARVASLMDEAGGQDAAYAAHTSSPSSLAMIGWQDSDGDGIFDALDVPLSLTGSGSYVAAAGRYRFTGSSTTQVLPSENPWGTRRALTLNTVDRVQYRIDGKRWRSRALEGTYMADLSLSLGPFAPGTHQVDIRTLDVETGVASSVFSDRFVVRRRLPGREARRDVTAASFPAPHPKPALAPGRRVPGGGRDTPGGPVRSHASRSGEPRRPSPTSRRAPACGASGRSARPAGAGAPAASPQGTCTRRSVGQTAGPRNDPQTRNWDA